MLDNGKTAESVDLLARWRLASAPNPGEPSVIRGEAYVPRLEFREADGNSRSLPYSSLDYVNFNPSVGITLTFSTCEIVLAGRNLRPLYEALNAHSVKTILVISDEFFETDSAETLVQSCQVKALR